MMAQRVFNAINAGLKISTKYNDLFFEELVRADTTITYYYNQDGKIHNTHGPAIVTRENGIVTRQKFVCRGVAYDDLIQSLVDSQSIELLTDDSGEITFSETDKFTITMAMEVE